MTWPVLEVSNVPCSCPDLLFRPERTAFRSPDFLLPVAWLESTAGSETVAFVQVSITWWNFFLWAGVVVTTPNPLPGGPGAGFWGFFRRCSYLGHRNMQAPPHDKATPDAPVTIHGESLDRVEEFTYLGSLVSKEDTTLCNRMEVKAAQPQVRLYNNNVKSECWRVTAHDTTKIEASEQMPQKNPPHLLAREDL